MKTIGVVSIVLAVGASAAQIPATAAAVGEEKVVLYSFAGGSDGAYPSAGLLDVKGMLYGVTFQGGTRNLGTAFSLDLKNGIETVLHSFGKGTDGINPSASLIDLKGTLYSTTLEGGSEEFCGSPGCGTVYSIDRGTGTEKVLHIFCGQEFCPDGANPNASLLAMNGTLYGTTQLGGNYNNDNTYGTVFAVDRKTDVETVVFSFCGAGNCASGVYPFGNLIDVNGTLYGTTFEGGRYDGGTVFALNPQTGAETVLYDFGSQQNETDGVDPVAGLVDVSGVLYGTTEEGGNSSCNDGFGCGVVFSVNPSTGQYKVLYSFCSRNDCADGAAPEGNLIAVNGILYGTTPAGGNVSCTNFGCGVVFSVDPATGAEKVLHSFCSQQNCTDGEYPNSGLTNVNGKLYGTTVYGGAHGYGTVFAFKLSEPIRPRHAKFSVGQLRNIQ